MFKKIFLALSATFILFAFTACKAKINKDVDIERVFPEKASMIFVLDYANSGQADKFGDLMGMFPETGIKKWIVEQLTTDLEAEGIDYEKDVKPIFEGGWEVGIAVSLKEEISEVEDLEKINPEEEEIYIVAKFEGADEVEALIQRENEETKKLVYEEVEDEIKFWTDAEENTYVVRYGDIFFMTDKEEYRDAALERLKTGEGYNTSVRSQIDALAKNNLGYWYIEGSLFSNVMKNLYANPNYYGPDSALKNEVAEINSVIQNDAFFTKYFELMGDVYITWFAEDDGLRFISNGQIIGDKSFVVPDPDYKLNLVEKVPSEGLFMYSEMPGFMLYFKSFMEGFFLGFYGVENSLYGTDVYKNPQDAIDTTKYYEDFIAGLAKTGKLSVAELEEMLDVPFAFAGYDTKGLIPGMVLYLQLDESQVENGKKLTNAMDDYIDEVIVEFDALMQSDLGGEGVGALKRDIELVGGGGMHKVYLDWSAFSEEFMSQANVMPGFDLKEVKLEFYYGVTGDGIMVFALYPNFAEAYEGEALSENDLYNEAKEKMGDNYGYTVSYFNTAPLIELMVRYAEMGVNWGFVSPADKKDVDFYVKQFGGTFKYFIGSSKLDGDYMKSDGFVKLEEVEDEKVEKALET